MFHLTANCGEGVWSWNCCVNFYATKVTERKMKHLYYLLCWIVKAEIRRVNHIPPVFKLERYTLDIKICMYWYEIKV